MHAFKLAKCHYKESLPVEENTILETGQSYDLWILNPIYIFTLWWSGYKNVNFRMADQDGYQTKQIAVILS